MIPAIILSTAVVFLAIGALFSTVVASVGRLSRVTLRAMAERRREDRYRLLEEAAHDRTQFLFPLEVVANGLVASVVALLTWLLMWMEVVQPLLWALLLAAIIPTLLLQFIPRLLTQSQAEAYTLRLLPLISAPYRLIRWLTAPLWLFLRRDRRRYQADSIHNPSSEEASEEEIQAYLGVGEEDGIFEEESTELIQSALEFGTTLVRDIMTPRSEIVGIQNAATVAELLNLIADSRHSRIPVYGVKKEEIVGVVYVRNLLDYLQNSNRTDPITPIVTKPWFVPESKKVIDLLSEMQQKSEPMAIVVSEYGAIDGLVTIEDLLEEIVGEIYDEDEAQETGLERDGDGSYIVPGGFEISALEEEIDADLQMGDVTTVSGLVVEQLGSVPLAGERVTIRGWEFEVLESIRTRIKKLRMRPEGTPGTSVPNPKS